MFFLFYFIKDLNLLFYMRVDVNVCVSLNIIYDLFVNMLAHQR